MSYHVRSTRALAAVLILAGCSGDPLRPADALAGRFELVSVDGQPLPILGPPSIGGSYVAITHGDLLLRRDGTFTIGTTDPTLGLGFLVRGTYATTADGLRLDVPSAEAGGPPTRLSATHADDRVEIAVPRTTMLPTAGPPATQAYVYERAPSPAPIAAGTYVLASLDGRSDLTWERVIGSERYLYRILFDSITVMDDVFFRRHRAERNVAYLARGDSLLDETEWTTYGSYTGGDGWLVLRDYTPRPWRPSRDSLAIGDGTLLRRTPLSAPDPGQPAVREERYDRHP